MATAPAVKAPTAAQTTIVSQIVSSIVAIDVVESTIATTLSGQFADHVRKAIPLGRQIKALMATFTTDKPSVRAALAFVVAADKSVKCSQTRFNNYVRIANVYDGLDATAITADIKLFTTEGPPAVNGTNPTFLSFLQWCERKPPATLAQVKSTKANAAKAIATVDMLLFDDKELKALRALVRAESDYRAKLKDKGGKEWTDYVASIAKAKAAGKGRKSAAV